MTREIGGLELASTVTLVLQANQITKCGSHPKIFLSCRQSEDILKKGGKILSNQTILNLINELIKKDKLSDNHMKPTKDFIRSVVYACESSENYLDTRVRIYKNLKRKISMNIPTDLDSEELAIKRAHLQIFTWLSCCKQDIQNLDLEELGWKSTDDELIKPLWFNVFTFTKMTFVINKMIFVIKD